jgi:hypothetical protein
MGRSVVAPAPQALEVRIRDIDAGSILRASETYRVRFSGERLRSRMSRSGAEGGDP